MLLDLPKKGEQITVKIVGNVEIKIKKQGKEFLCPCTIWCDYRRKPEKHGNLFLLRLNELSIGILETYKALEELVGDEYKLDKDLVRIVGDIFTIKCIDEGKDKDTGKILGNYLVDLREDLKEMDMKASSLEIFEAKKTDYYECQNCVDRNMVKVDEEYATRLRIKEIQEEMRKQRHGIIRNHSVSQEKITHGDIETSWDTM